MASRSRIAHPFPWRVRLASLLFVLAWMAGVMAAGFFFAGLFFENESFFRITVAGIALLVALVLGAILIGHRLNCPVCANPAFVVRRCLKHRRARKFLGFSYRLGLSLEALARSRFHCMYCGERIPLQKASPGRRIEIIQEAPSGEHSIAAGAGGLPPRRG